MAILPGFVNVPSNASIALFENTNRWRGQSVYIIVGANDIHIGPDSDVTTTGNGYAQGGKRGTKLTSSMGIALAVDAGETLYARATAGTSGTEVLLQGN